MLLIEPICVFCVPYGVTKVLAIFKAVVHASAAHPWHMKIIVSRQFLEFSAADNSRRQTLINLFIKSAFVSGFCQRLNAMQLLPAIFEADLEPI
jgi:hypothetical protein